MDEYIKVSIIMPSLNVSGYIEEAIESAVKQSMREIEIICIDAGSTDGTWEIIQKYAKNDHRIKTSQSSVKSYGLQCNLGLRMARGKYVAILETDDFISESMYERLYNISEEENLDFVKCNYKTFSTGTGGDRKYISRKVSYDVFFYKNVFVPSEYPESAEDDWYLWNGIYRNDFLKKNAICFYETPGASFQDIGFLHKVNSQALRAKYVEESYYFYRVDRDGASSNEGKSLRYAKGQYHRLMEELEGRQTNAQLKLLYRRMANSYVRAVMYSGDKLLETEEAGRDTIWFVRNFIDAERFGVMDANEIPLGLKESYKYLTQPLKGFLSYRKERRRTLKEFICDNEIIIFGCGVFGKNALRIVAESNGIVKGFMDNNKDLQGKVIDGVYVYSPEEIPNIDNVRFLIANEKYAAEIDKQIHSIKSNALTFRVTSELVYSTES